MSSSSSVLLGNDPVERSIHRLSIFEPLDTEAREAFRRAVARGPLIVSYQEVHEEALPDVTILLSGWMCQFRLLDNGRRQITALVVPGDFIDFGFLTGNGTHIQSVSTVPSQLGRIRQFSELAQQYPAIIRAAPRAAAIDAAISRERLISLGLRTAIERVSPLLCELWHRLSAVGLASSEGGYDLPMTQAELGAALGLSTVHVNRTIQVLRKSGTISLQGGKVVIHDLRQLAALAGFDAGYLSGGGSGMLHYPSGPRLT